jgi:hypothetical protein
MENEIVSLQNNPLLQASFVEDTPPLTLVQNRIILYIFGKVLERSKANGWELSKMTDDEMSLSMVHYDIPWDLDLEIKVGKGGNQTAEIWHQLNTLHKTGVILKGSNRSTYLIQAVDPPKVAEGKYRVQLDPEILRNVHYREGEIYRLIKMKYALALGSVNHFNLYKILKAVENLREWKIELEELKAMLHLQDQYPKYAHFRGRVLETSQKALKEDTDISFDFKEMRGARKKVTHLIFKVKKGKTIEQAKATPYTTELETELKARGIQHLNTLANQGLTKEHWNRALETELREGALVVEARKNRDQATGEQAKAKAKESQAERMKRNKDWFLSNRERFPSSWWNDEVTVFTPKGINFAWDNFQDEIEKHG